MLSTVRIIMSRHSSRAARRGRPSKQINLNLGVITGCFSLFLAAVLLCGLSVFVFRHFRDDRILEQSKIDVEELWRTRLSHGWRPSSMPGNEWNSPPDVKNGFLVVHCNGGLNRQRRSISNAVLVARIMNATLVLPVLDTTEYWHENSGFSDVYDVDHFIKSLENDVEIVRVLPRTRTIDNKKKPFRPFQLRPPRNASLDWFENVALQKMIDHGAVYMTPFSSQFLADIDNRELQKLRCRVFLHALRFREDVRQLASEIVKRLRSESRFLAVHLQLQTDMLSLPGCLSTFTEEQREILKRYQTENSAEKGDMNNEQKFAGKCPLSPREVGLILQSMGFDNSTRIYVATGSVFGGEEFMQPLLELFPRLETRSSVATSEELAAIDADDKGLLGSAVDYMVCLLADIFMSNYDGPSYFANNLIGQRLYYGFRTSIQPDRKFLAPILTACENGICTRFDDQIRLVLKESRFGDLHPRVPPESLYTNPWPDCFCNKFSESDTNRCVPGKLFPSQEGAKDYVDEETM